MNNTAPRQYTDEELVTALVATKDKLVEVKGQLAWLEDQISTRKLDTAQKVFEANGKEFGEITFVDANGLKYKAVREQKIKWDNAALQKIAAGMDWKSAQRVFKIEFGLSETIYKSLRATGNAELNDALAAARTTIPGALKVVYAGGALGETA